MTRLAHLTDLHFGLHHPDLLAPLRDALRAADPDVVAVSGDLTQRALPGQFAAARAFLRSLDRPFLTIPGNHDLPVFNPLRRLFDPFGPYRRGADANLVPTLRVGRLRLFGINTADALQWRGGVARPAEIDRICRALAETPVQPRSATHPDGPPGVINVALCHHPLQEPPGFQRGETGGGSLALSRMAAAGLHVALSGHLHHWTAGLDIGPASPQPVFQMQTGTALCARAHESDHGFALLAFDRERLTATPWILDPATRRFTPRAATTCTRHAGRWHVTA